MNPYGRFPPMGRVKIGRILPIAVRVALVTFEFSNILRAPVRGMGVAISPNN
jgi:hypothetical protein